MKSGASALLRPRTIADEAATIELWRRIWQRVAWWCEPCHSQLARANLHYYELAAVTLLHRAFAQARSPAHVAWN